MKEIRRAVIAQVLDKPDGAITLATIQEDNRFFQRQFTTVDAALAFAEEAVLHPRQSLYLAMGTQIAGTQGRKKDTFSHGTMLWADIDLNDPSLLTVKPTLLLETSPDKYQAFWFLQDSLSPKKVEKLVKDIATVHGYDKVQSIEHLMRMPGTHSHKQQVPENWQAKVVQFNPTLEYDAADFVRYADAACGVEDEAAPPDSDFEPREAAHDRSAAFYGEVCLLFDRNAHKTKDGLRYVLELAKGSVNNKWGNDAALWVEIQRIYAKWLKKNPEAVETDENWLLAPTEIDAFFADLPEKMDFHIDNLSLWYDRPNLIYGKEGCGKSYFVTRIMTEYAKQYKTPAMLIASEAQLAHARRLKGLSVELYPYMANIHELTQERVDTIAQLVKEKKIKLLVIDVMGIFLEDENHSKSWNAFFKQIKPFNDNKELAVVLVHHARKDGRDGDISYRGTSAITGACDLVLALWKDDTNVLHVESQKATWMEEHPTLMYHWITDNGRTQVKPLSDEKIMLRREATDDLVIAVLKGMQVGGRWKQGVSPAALVNELKRNEIKVGKADSLKKKLRQMYKLEEVRGRGGAFHSGKETDLFRVKKEDEGNE